MGQYFSTDIAAMADITDAGKDTTLISVAIEEAAFQIRLLAMNGMLEAAWAGAQARDFGTMAFNVGNLAWRSSAEAAALRELQPPASCRTDERRAHRREGIDTTVPARLERVRSILAEIVAASGNRAAGPERVKEGIMQMDPVAPVDEAAVGSTLHVADDPTRAGAPAVERPQRPD